MPEQKESVPARDETVLPQGEAVLAREDAVLRRSKVALILEMTVPDLTEPGMDFTKPETDLAGPARAFPMGVGRLGYPARAMNLREELGSIDIYLLDQLLKGRLAPGMSLFDAGCGGGRNLVYFLRQGYEVHGVDENPRAIEQVRQLARELAPEAPPERFQVSDLAEIPYPANRFDAVLCSAVLHFSRDEAHFDCMLTEMWRVLKPGGLFFARLASTIGVETLVRPLQGRWYALPDGSERFLVDEEMLERTTARLGGIWLDPLKTTVVQNQRSMSTWVLRKGG